MLCGVGERYKWAKSRLGHLHLVSFPHGANFCGTITLGKALGTTPSMILNSCILHFEAMSVLSRD